MLSAEQQAALISSSVQKLPDCVFMLNRAGQFIYVNNSTTIQLGYTRQELLERCIWDIDTTCTKEKFTSNWIYQNTFLKNRVTIHRTKEGKEIPVSVITTYEKHGEQEFFVSHARGLFIPQPENTNAPHEDIKPEQLFNRLMEELEEHRTLLHGVIDELPNPLVVKDYEGKFVLTNRAVASLYGVDNPKDMIGKDDGDYIPDPEQAEFFKKNVREIMDGGETQTVFEDSYDAVTGERRHYMSIKKPFLNQKGEKHIIVIANDVTEIRKAEQALLQYEKIMSVSYDFLSFQDKNGFYQAVNDAYLKAFNITREEIIGKSNREILGEEHYDKYIKPKFEKALSGGIDSYETWVNFPAYGDRFVEVNYYPYRPDDDGNIEGVVVKVNDITDRKRMEEALEEQKNLFRGVIDELPSPLVVKDYEGKFILTNQAVASLYGVDDPDDMIGKDDGDYIPDPEQAEFFRRNVREVMDGGKTQTVYEDSYDAVTGERRHYMSIKKPFLNQKEEKHILVIANDITEIRKAEKTLLHYEKIMSISHDFLAYLDANCVYQAINNAYLQAFQLPREEIIGKSIKQLFGEEIYEKEVKHYLEKSLAGEVVTYSMWFIFPALGKRFVEMSFHPYYEEGSSALDGLILKVDDITDHHELQEGLRHIANHDTLTGLANRRLFSHRLSQTLKRAKRQNSQAAVLFVDLDRFKSINDTLGHSMGDKVLLLVADRLSHRLRETDTLARSGGDEFLLLLEDFNHLQDVVNICENLLEILSQPMFIDEHELFLSASIGVSIYPNDATNQEKLIESADTAMYQAKKSGRNAYQFSSPELREHLFERVFLEKNLRLALAHNEFSLLYQPQINIQTQEIVGSEILLRWRQPAMGTIPQEKFVSVAEECGLIVPLGRWVLESGCRQMKFWLDAGYELNSISVNVSINQLLQPNFSAIVQECLEKSDLAPCYLELEITENYLLEDMESISSKLKSIDKLGVGIAIDGFGTSYSSLRYLQQLPVSKLKIDRSFVQDVPDNKEDSVIVKTAIDIARNMDLTVIAEGVENKAQVKFLQDAGCMIAQGSFYASPMQAESFQEEYLEAKKIEID